MRFALFSRFGAERQRKTMERIRLTEEGRQALRGIRGGTLRDDELRAWTDVVKRPRTRPTK